MRLVNHEIKNRVALVQLNDPARRNAMSLPMAEAMVGVLEQLEPQLLSLERPGFKDRLAALKRRISRAP